MKFTEILKLALELNVAAHVSGIGWLLCVLCLCFKFKPKEDKAMESVPTKRIHEWIKENIGKSLQSIRKKVFNSTIKAEKNRMNLSGCLNEYFRHLI